jgi:hypothetical protein
MPTVIETIQAHAGLAELRDRSKRLRLLLVAAFLVGVVLIVPPIDSSERSGFFLSAALIGPALGAAYREYRFGGTPRLVMTAAMTGMGVSAIVIAALLAAWLVIGGRLAFLNPLVWFFSSPMEIQIGVLIGVMVLLVVDYFVRKPARARASEAFEASVRAERERRGLPTAP